MTILLILLQPLWLALGVWITYRVDRDKPIIPFLPHGVEVSGGEVEPEPAARAPYKL